MTLTKDLAVLRKHPTVRQGGTGETETAGFTSGAAAVLSGDELFHEGDYGDAVYIILDGKADILVDSPSGSIKLRRSARTSSARSRSFATCRAPRRSSRMAISRPCACRRMASSTWSRNFHRLASK